MSDDMINIIGIGVLALLFWYIQIYRPKQKLKTPGELQLKPALSNDTRTMYRAIHSVFDKSYIISNNICLDDLIYSPTLNAKPYFHKALREQKIAWLILNESGIPVLAVDYETTGDELKLNFLANAGIPLCVFATGTDMEQLVKELTDAINELSHTASDTITNENPPEAA